MRSGTCWENKTPRTWNSVRTTSGSVSAPCSSGTRRRLRLAPVWPGPRVSGRSARVTCAVRGPCSWRRPSARLRIANDRFSPQEFESVFCGKTGRRLKLTRPDALVTCPTQDSLQSSPAMEIK